MQNFSTFQTFLLLNLFFNTGLLAAEGGGDPLDFFDFFDFDPVAVGDFIRFTPFCTAAATGEPLVPLVPLPTQARPMHLLCRFFCTHGAHVPHGALEHPEQQHFFFLATGFITTSSVLFPLHTSIGE